MQGVTEKSKIIARATMRRALDLLLPPQCVVCARPLLEELCLCPSCFAKMPFIEAPVCERLGTPFEEDFRQAMLSPRAIARPPVFNRARAVARFDGPARDMVHRLKYGDRTDLAPALGRWMARAGRELLDCADVLVPVPLHGGRLWQRRFNQSALLARAISAESGVPVSHLVSRVRATRSQVGLSASERARNLQGALRPAEGQLAAIRGKRLVLVDDVMTTGSTANAAARALLRAGASNVDVLLFALVVDDGRVHIGQA